jgi:ADP-heptose:LPS heptosyltransferase
VEAALDLASAAGGRPAAGDDGRLKLKQPLPQHNPVAIKPYVVVHPGASVPSRALTAEHAAGIVGALSRAGWPVVVTGGPGERDLAELAAGVTAINLAGRTDLPQLARVLADAACVVVGNTGPAHLAAAVGTPVVSLFSPVVPSDRWRPYGVPTVLLGDQLAGCRDSRARDCPLPGHPCLSQVSGEDVVAAVDRLTAHAVAGVPG